MKKLKMFFVGSSSLQRKMTAIYLTVSVLPIFFICVLSYIVYYNGVLKEAYALIEQNMQQHEIVIEERLDSYESVLYEMVCDSNMIKMAKVLNSDVPGEKIVEKNNMNTILQNYIYTYDGIRSIVWMSQKDFVGYSRWYSSVGEVIWSNPEIRQEVYTKIQENPTEITYMPGINLAKNGKRTDYTILAGFQVQDLYTKENAGILVLALDADILNFDGKSKKFSEEKRKKTGVSTLVIDEKNRILSGGNVSYTTKNYEEFVEDNYQNIQDTHIYKEEIGDTGWAILNILDQNIYLKEIHAFTGLVITLAILITLLFFAIAFLVSRKYLNTIGMIAKGISEFEGTVGTEMQVDTKDELYMIAIQFNKMTRRIRDLVETLKKKNIEIAEAVNRRKDAEIKALEAQINPHFLYNTLDSINWRAIENNEEEISDMLGALGSLLRYSVSNIDKMVVLRAEIKWLEKYVFLQRDRFHYSFDCMYDIEEAAMDFPVYKMMLQPIVENTILHAFEAVKEGGMIWVKAYVKENRLHISIRDNGSGIEEKKLQEIQKEISEAGPLDSHSIGISNVVNRLKIYYGKNAKIEVDSKLGEGTEFRLILPEPDTLELGEEWEARLL